MVSKVLVVVSKVLVAGTVLLVLLVLILALWLRAGSEADNHRFLLGELMSADLTVEEEELLLLEFYPTSVKTRESAILHSIDWFVVNSRLATFGQGDHSGIFLGPSEYFSSVGKCELARSLISRYESAKGPDENPLAPGARAALSECTPE